MSLNSLEGLMLKLKLQYFGHLIQRADSLEKLMMNDECVLCINVNVSFIPEQYGDAHCHVKSRIFTFSST